MADIAGLHCSELDGVSTGTGTTDARTIDDDRLEGVEGKVDITTLDKTNKILILISC